MSVLSKNILDSIPPPSPEVDLSSALEQSRATQRRRLFAYAWLASGFNATRAAIDAGYEPGSAARVGSMLLKDKLVQKEIKKQYLALFRSKSVKGQRVLLEIMRLAFADYRHLEDENGQPIPLHKLSEDVTAAVSSVEYEYYPFQTDTGEIEMRARPKKIKMHSNKLGAVVQLAKVYGIIKDELKVDMQHSGHVTADVNVQSQVPPWWGKLTLETKQSVLQDLETAAEAEDAKRKEIQAERKQKWENPVIDVNSIAVLDSERKDYNDGED